MKCIKKILEYKKLVSKLAIIFVNRSVENVSKHELLLLSGKVIATDILASSVHLRHYGVY